MKGLQRSDIGSFGESALRGGKYLWAGQAGGVRTCESRLVTNHVRKSSSARNAGGGQATITVTWRMQNATV
ncbi:MAG: hypothetical protein V1904_09110 [Bacteroidota bacterium]